MSESRESVLNPIRLVRQPFRVTILESPVIRNLVVAVAIFVAASDPSSAGIRIREGRPGESHLVRTTSISGTIVERYPESSQISLYCPGGIPDMSQGLPASMRFSIVTDDFEADVPPSGSIISATLDIRTNGYFLRHIVATGVDPNPPRIVPAPPPSKWKRIAKRSISLGATGMAILSFAAAVLQLAIGLLFRHASVTTGEIVAASGKAAWGSVVAFKAGGRRYTFKTWRRIHAGTEVEVRYLLNDPRSARLGGTHQMASLLAFAGFAFLIVRDAFG